MKILHVIWKPSIGGAELFALNLAMHQSVKHDIDICYLGAHKDELSVMDGVTVTACEMSSGFDLSGLRRFYHFIKNSSFDVVHNHQNLPSVVVAILADSNALHVRHEHGSNTAGWKSHRERFLSRLINRWVPLYIANSKSTREMVIDFERVKPEKIHVVPCGIDIKRFCNHENNALLRETFSIPEDAPLIGFIGRLHKQKGVDDFVHVCSIVSEKLKNAHFIITGDGPMRKDIEHTIVENGMSNVVHLAGFRKNIPAILAEYTILIVPSRQEAQGLTAIEAMASGVPVVAFAVGGLPEVMGDAGIIINNRDAEEMAQAVINLTEDDQLRLQIIEKGQQQMKQFDMDTITQRIVSLYCRYSGIQDK